jgi:hypothetical protein
VGLTKGVIVSLLTSSVVDCGFDQRCNGYLACIQCGRLWVCPKVYWLACLHPSVVDCGFDQRCNG